MSNISPSIQILVFEMTSKLLIVTIILISLSSFAASERILGAFIFQQHGDRTTKFKPPVTLTEQGDREQYLTGRYFHDRYISPSSSSRIWGIGLDTHDSLRELDCFTEAQVKAEAPDQDMILLSAKAFLRGLYPSILVENQINDLLKTPHKGKELNEESAHKSVAHAHVVNTDHPVTIKSFHVDNEPTSFWDPNWDECDKVKGEMYNYGHSSRYQSLLDSTRQFYQSLAPLLQKTPYYVGLDYENAYQIWDIFNSDLIHRPDMELKFSSANLSSQVVMQELSNLATTTRFGWTDDTGPKIGGLTLVGKVLSELNKIINKKSHKRLHIEFGSPELLISFFRVNEIDPLPSLGSYSSTLVWELVTDAPGTKYPSKEDISVRFLAHEGPSISNASSLAGYPLFHSSSTNIPWKDFKRLSKQLGVISLRDWCNKCDMPDYEGKCNDKFTYIGIPIIIWLGTLFVMALVICIGAVCSGCCSGCCKSAKKQKPKKTNHGNENSNHGDIDGWNSGAGVWSTELAELPRYEARGDQGNISTV